jgi:hypothetical protein
MPSAPPQALRVREVHQEGCQTIGCLHPKLAYHICTAPICGLTLIELLPTPGFIQAKNCQALKVCDFSLEIIKKTFRSFFTCKTNDFVIVAVFAAA